MEKQRVPTIKDLYPDLTDEQLTEAEENFDLYLEVIWRIHQRIRSDPEAYSHFKTLTGLRQKEYDNVQKVEPD